MFINLILTFLIGHLASSLPLNQTDSTIWCNSSEFKYFQENPNNAKIYYQCDPWGNSTELHCSNNTVWNSWLVKCDQIENLRNLTLNIVLQSRDFDCTKNKCLNKGICNKEQKCECLPQFTGQKCENHIQSIVEDIFSQNFNLTNFKNELKNSKNFVDANYYEKYRYLIDNQTYSKLENYLDMFQDGVRFDTLVNNLVHKLLQEIYPDSEFLAFFNFYNQTIGSLLRLMPSVLSYSRYAAERYEIVLEHYKNVLTQLIENLIMQEKDFDQKAMAYKSLNMHFLNETFLLSNDSNSLANRTFESMKLDEVNLKENLRLNFEHIVDSSEQLFDILENFHFNLINQFGLSNSSIYEIIFEKSGFDNLDKVYNLFTSIKSSSQHVWNSLNNFGFWFITNFLSKL